MRTKAEDENEREIHALASRPYAMVIENDPEDGWIGRIPQMPGLLAVGDTVDEMLALAEDAKRAWIATALKLGRPIPEPEPTAATPEKSGKFVVRVPPAIHAAVAREASRQHVSLNELVSDVLSIVAAKGFEYVVESTTRRETNNPWQTPSAQSASARIVVEQARQVGQLSVRNGIAWPVGAIPTETPKQTAAVRG